MDCAWQRMSLQPQHARGGSWIDTDLAPPGGLIAIAMNLAVVPSAERNSELVTDLSAECW